MITGGPLMKRCRGRPVGYIMSKTSKDKIANTKSGQSCSQKTKDKIAKSLVKYFDKKGRKRPMAHAKRIAQGEQDPNTIELMKSFMKCGQLIRKLLNDSDLELTSVTVTGAMGLDGGEKQSEYFSDEVDGIKGTKFTFSMRKRALFELPALIIPGEHFLKVMENMANKYPSLPLKIKELTIWHVKSNNIYTARVYGYIRKSVDARQLLVIRMNSKKHTYLSPIEYGEMLDDLLQASIRQCYFEYQVIKAAKLCSIKNVKRDVKKAKKVKLL